MLKNKNNIKFTSNEINNLFLSFVFPFLSLIIVSISFVFERNQFNFCF